jgi:site-specific recombinase XerD
MTTRTDTTLEDGTLTPGDLRVLIPDFERSLRARNLSRRTVGIYGDGARLFVAFLLESGMPTEAPRITRDHVETFIERQLADHKPATACQRYNALAQLFRWLVDEGEITDTPMARMKRPRIPEELVPVLDDDALRKLLATASTKSFLDVRDMAIMRLFIDTGMRLGEMAGLKLEDIDRDHQTAYVMGKGRRPRVCPYGAKTATAIDRYMRLRRNQTHARLDHLWITRQGYATNSAIYRVIRERARAAGLGDVHPHQLRHSTAHDNLAEGMSEGNVMMLMGWRSPAMLRRYGAAQAANRAEAAFRQLGGHGDRL